MQYALDLEEYEAVYDIEKDMKAKGIPVDHACLQVLLRASALNGKIIIIIIIIITIIIFFSQ